MSLAELTTGFTDAAFEAFLTARHEPKWLLEQRRSAWQRFKEMELPSRREEEWMRTDIRLLRLDRFRLPLPGQDPGERQAAPLLSHGVDLAGHTITVNSRHAGTQLDPAWADRGVLFGSLDELIHRHSELLKPHLSVRAGAGKSEANPYADKFAALQTAAWSGGALLYVPRGVSIERPLHSLSALCGGSVDFSRLVVILEEGAEATLLTETAGDAQPGLHCGSMELHVGPAARLRFVNLQNWGTGVWHFAHQLAVVERDGRLQWTIGALGSRLATVNQHVQRVGPRAEAQVNGVMFTEGKQHLSYHTLQHHRAEACKSDLLYKGGLQDQSRLVWRGMIKVDPGAQKTDGYQRNDNLILSEGARADSIPGLEIEADDVRCTHGATTGRVDDEQVFYCRSRGLTRKEAIRMIVAGFFQQVFDRITIDSVREALGDAIGRRVREYA